MTARPLPATFPLREQTGVITSSFTVALLGVLGPIVGYFVTAGALLSVLELLALGVGVVGAALGAALGVMIARRYKRTITPAPIEVTASSVRLPRSVSSPKTADVPLEQIRSVEARGTQKAPLLVLGTDQGFFAYPMRAFVEDDAPPALRDTIRHAVAQTQDGAARLAEMDRLEADGRTVARKRPRATQVLLGVIAGVFVFELSAGSPDDPEFLLRWGANAPALVEDGQWWRLFVAGFMHLSFVHFFLNASALFSLGGVVEKVLGSARFLVVALGASLAGNLASMMTHRHVYSAGTSSLIFGLIGALLVVNLRFGRSLPAGFLLGARRWISLLGINALVSCLPGVDGLAHLGGLLGGALLCLALVPRITLDERPPRPLDVAAASALVAAFALAFGIGGAHALRSDAAVANRDLMHAALSSSALSPERVNTVAWAVAIDGASAPDTLALAERAMRKAVAAVPDNGAFLDTLAALRRRQGALDDALALARRAGMLKPEAEVFSQLARMLQERTSVDNRASVRVQDGALLVDVDASLPGAVVYARTRTGTANNGLLRVVLPPGAHTLTAPLPPGLPPDSSAKVYLVDTTGPELAPTRAAPITWFPHDARVDARP